jgi:hypothetical protein
MKGAPMRTGKTKTGFALGISCRLACAIPMFAPPTASAAPPEADPSGTVTPDASAAAQAENNGQDFTRPESLFQLRNNLSSNPGGGSEPGTTREVDTNTVTLRADRKVELAPDWKLALRADLPFVVKNPITSDNPDGSYLSGLGDADFQAALIHDFDARWAAGAGARLIAPTGAEDISSEKWQIMPLAGARYMLPEISNGSYVLLLARYDVSFGGDPSKRNISNLQLAPTVNITLPDHWFVTLYPSPDIRVNYGDPVTGQTGRLFLPLDFSVGRKLSRDLVLSLEIGIPLIKDYPVYDFKTIARINYLY